MKPLTQGKTYWLRNPRYGTIQGTVAIVSGNFASSFFFLDDPIMIHIKDVGATILAELALMQENGVFHDIVTGSSWEVLDDEPNEG